MAIYILNKSQNPNHVTTKKEILRRQMCQSNSGIHSKYMKQPIIIRPSIKSLSKTINQYIHFSFWLQIINQILMMNIIMNYIHDHWKKNLIYPTTGQSRTYAFSCWWYHVKHVQITNRESCIHTCNEYARHL